MEDFQNPIPTLEEKIKGSSSEDLDQLMKSGDEKVRAAVAAHGKLSESQFIRLVADESSLVRSSVPVNELVPESALALLAGDSEWTTRWAVAMSNNVRRPILELLVDDENATVRDIAKEHLEHIGYNNSDLTH